MHFSTEFLPFKSDFLITFDLKKRKNYLVQAVYPETRCRLSSPSPFSHLWLEAARVWHEVKMFHPSNSENSAQGQIHLRGFDTSICLAVAFFFFFSEKLHLAISPYCLYVPRHTFTQCGSGFRNWIPMSLFLEKKNKWKTNLRTIKYSWLYDSDMYKYIYKHIM